MSIKVDESVQTESCGKNQNDFLNWLQAKLEDEMEKPTYKTYVESERSESPRRRGK